MTDNMDSVVRNMSRFGELLSLVGLPELGQGYKEEAEKLDRDRSEPVVAAARDWIRETFKYQGSGSIPDQYVAYPDGSANLPLTTEYHDLRRYIGSFVKGD